MEVLEMGNEFLPRADGSNNFSGRSNPGDGDGQAESVQLRTGTDWNQAEVSCRSGSHILLYSSD